MNSTSTLSPSQLLKMSVFARGMKVDPRAVEHLTKGGRVPLSLDDYATTNGITLRLEGDIFVNAPYGDWFCADAEATLRYDAGSDRFHAAFAGELFEADPLPLPGYVGKVDAHGRPITAVVMSHGDRLRLSPIAGCSMDCAFCDMSGIGYKKRPAGQLVEAMRVAQTDEQLPVRHILISGGTPSKGDIAYFDEVCRSILLAADRPVDVMAVPREDTAWIDRLVDMGVHGFAINVEVFRDDVAGRVIRLKRRPGLTKLAENLYRAVQLTGGQGRVRSLLVVGLELIEDTLAGVDFIAALGCDPVLSPFRPARGTPLASYPPPSMEFLERVYLESQEIAERRGVKLGPRCVPCQNNTLTFPDARTSQTNSASSYGSH